MAHMSMARQKNGCQNAQCQSKGAKNNFIQDEPSQTNDHPLPQPHCFCRAHMISIQGFLTRAYKNDGFGNQWYSRAEEPWLQLL